jgi:error-prone DNA polymerase
MAAYVELQVTSAFSFQRGGSQPEELAERAAKLGYTSFAVTDRNSLAGVPRAYFAAKQYGLRLIVGCRLDLQDGPSLLAYPTDISAYARLSNLLTIGNLRAEKGACHLWRKDVYALSEGIKFVVIPPYALNDLFDLDPAFEKALEDYKQGLGKDLYMAITHYYKGDDAKRLYRIAQLAKKLSIPLVATNDVLYDHPYRRALHDVLTSTRIKKTIYNAGYALQPNAESYLKPGAEMIRLFKDYSDAIRATREIAQRCRFSLEELKYVYPAELTDNGRTPQQQLTHLTWEGAKERWGDSIPAKIKANIQHELDFISGVNYAPYFLTVEDIVRFARSENILCQGRGSAANSTVCYCLGITNVDPAKFDLLFERFVSSARNEPPDIDVDFEHERREEVIQYIYRKYGRDRAAIVATVTQQMQRGGVRDVGRAMGMSTDTVGKLASSVWQYTEEGFDAARLKENGLSFDDPTVYNTVGLTEQMYGMPRQLGQHTGGFVITDGKLSDLCPIMNARMEDRTCIEWNKDDIDKLGFMKIDVLGLGMLTCIRKAFDLLQSHYGRHVTLANIPQDDPAVYDMITAADTIGVFQIESRAQMNMLPRMKPRNFYDLVIEVAIVRPGPIQGKMVHPYLRRRNGEEPVDYPSEELKEVLERTLGVPLFQEQVMKIAMVAAGFTAAEADDLRRSMATFKFKGLMHQFEEKLVNGMLARGYQREYAERIFEQLKGFGSYGFPESHAASFAHLVYASCWIKHHYPDVFACALLNSQPMGFYHPAQIVGCARDHGVKVLPVDVNYSDWDHKLETKDGKYYTLRLGFRQMDGFKIKDADCLIDRRRDGYRDIASIWHAGVSKAGLEKLADADAYRSLGLDRREALWEVIALADRPAAVLSGQRNESIYEPPVALPAMTESESVVEDYASLSLSLRAHPVSFLREKLKKKGIIQNANLKHARNGQKVYVCGMVLVRQRPGTAGGVCFMTIEDETGKANLVVFKNLFEKYRKEIHSKLVMAEGTLQKEGEVINVVVRCLTNLTSLLNDLTKRVDSDLPLLSLSHADEGASLNVNSIDRRCQIRKDSAEPAFPRARNFR